MVSKKEIRDKISYFPCVRGNDYDYYCYDDAYEFFEKSIDNLTEWILELVENEREEATETADNNAWEKTTYDFQD